MTWTYRPDQLASSARDRVRLLVGDTDITDQQISDEEIDWWLTQVNNSHYMAAVRVCETIASFYAKKMDKNVGDLSLQFSQQRDNYLRLASSLRNRYIDASPLASGMGQTYLGGAQQDHSGDTASFNTTPSVVPVTAFSELPPP